MTAAVPSRKGAAHGRNIGRWLLGKGYRVEVRHAERVPRRGRLIVAANHRGVIDGPLLVSAAPRPVHLLTRTELFQPQVERTLAVLGQIPFDPSVADYGAIDQAVSLLSDEQAIAMFPEGGRDRGDFSRIHPWIAYLAAVTGAPIVPAAIRGTWSAGMARDGLPAWRSQLMVTFGEPFDPAFAGDPHQRAVIGSVTEQIRQRLADEVAGVRSIQSGGPR